MSRSNFDKMLQELYAYGLQEVWDVAQARYDRIAG